MKTGSIIAQYLKLLKSKGIINYNKEELKTNDIFLKEILKYL